MTKQEKLILVGVISSANGIRGDVIVKSYTNPIENIMQLNVTDKNSSPVDLKLIRTNTKERLICSLPNCTDRTQAEAIKGTKLYCTRADLPEPDEEEFYFEDLKQMKVLNESGEEIGIVSNVGNFGAGDIIEVKFNDDQSEEMFPFTEEAFPKIENGYVTLSESALTMRIK